MDGEAREIQLDGVENRERLFRSNIKNRCEGNKLKERKGKRQGSEDQRTAKAGSSSPLDERPREFFSR